MTTIPTMPIMDIIMIVIGIYIIYVASWMKKNSKPHKVVLAEEEQKKCKDPKGFANYLCVKMLLFAISVIICGIIGFLADLVFKETIWINWCMLALFLVSFGIFTYFYRKAREQYVLP